jgi:hypothetical protein
VRSNARQRRRRAGVFPPDHEAKENGFMIAQSRHRRGAATWARAKQRAGSAAGEPMSSLTIMKPQRAGLHDRSVQTPARRCNMGACEATRGQRRALLQRQNYLTGW